MRPLIGALGIVILASGCGAVAQEEEATPTTAAVESTTVEAANPANGEVAVSDDVQETTAPVEDVAPVLVDTFTDKDGYEYTIEIAQAEITAEQNVADAKPGEVNIGVSFRIAGSVTNATDGRNAPAPNLGYTVVWEASSPVCSLASTGRNTALTSAFFGPAEDKYCTVFFRKTLSIEGQLGVAEIRDIEESTSGGFVAPEEHADAVLEAAEQPYAFVLTRERAGSSPQPFDCGVSWNSGYLSAASAEISGCSRFAE